MHLDAMRMLVEHILLRWVLILILLLMLLLQLLQLILQLWLKFRVQYLMLQQLMV